MGDSNDPIPRWLCRGSYTVYYATLLSVICNFDSELQNIIALQIELHIHAACVEFFTRRVRTDKTESFYVTIRKVSENKRVSLGRSCRLLSNNKCRTTVKFFVREALIISDLRK